jgi:hypothetical protein
MWVTKPSRRFRRTIFANQSESTRRQLTRLNSLSRVAPRALRLAETRRLLAFRVVHPNRLNLTPKLFLAHSEAKKYSRKRLATIDIALSCG